MEQSPIPRRRPFRNDTPVKAEHPRGFSNCPRCKYLENLAMSQQNQIDSMEQSQGVISDLKSWKGYLDNADSSPGISWEQVDLGYIMSKQGVLTESEAAYIKSVVRGLYSKLRGLTDSEEQVRRLREELANSMKSRTELQESIKETSDELKLEIKRHSELVSHAYKEKDEIGRELSELKKSFRDIASENDILKGKLQALETERRGLQDKMRNLGDWEKYAKELEGCLDESEGQRDGLRKQYAQTIQEFEKHCRQQQDQQQKLINDKQILQDTLQQQYTKVNDILQERDSIIDDYNKLASELQATSDQNVQLSNKVKQLELNLANWNKYKQELLVQNQENEANIKKLLQDREQLNQNYNQLVAQYNSVVKQRQDQHTELIQLKDYNYDLQEENSELKGQILKLTSDLEAVRTERDALRADLRKLQQKFEGLKHERDNLELNIRIISEASDKANADVSSLTNKNFNLSNQLTQKAKEYDDLSAYSKKLEGDLKNASMQKDRLQLDVRELNQQVSRSAQERQMKDKEFAVLFKDFGNLKDEHSRLGANLQGVEDQAKKQQAQLTRFGDVEKSCEIFKNQANKQAALNQNLQGQVSSAQQELEFAINEFNNKTDEWAVNQAELEDEASALEKALRERDNDLAEMKREEINLNAEIANLEQHLCVQEDLNQVIDGLQSQNDQVNLERNRAIDELDLISDIMVAQSEKALTTNKVIEDLKDTLEERDAELDVLRNMVANLQRSNPVYMPKKDDPIDIALADYLNTRSQKVDVPFTREDMGVYLFGTKRVFVKLENGKIISKFYIVRVGGGYMTIDEFVDIYTPIELDKFANRQRDEKHALRKAILGKFADKLIDNERSRGGEMSPGRAGKFLRTAVANTGYATCYAVPRKVSSPSKASSPRRSPKKLKKGRSFNDIRDTI